MNLLHLEQFYEVAKVGSVSVGARKLRLSQPALSKSIRLLEEQLGTRLFERSKKGMELTHSGKITFDFAGRIFSEARNLETEVRSQGEVLRGEFSIGASDNLAIYIFPRILQKLKKEHPFLKLQLFSGTSTDIKNEILGDRCEAGFFYTEPKSYEPFQTKLIGNTEFWIVAQPGLFSKKKTPTLQDLKELKIPRIESRHKDYGDGFPAHFHSKKLGLTDAPFLEANLHEVKKRLVLEGAGFALLTRHSVEAEVKSGQLIRIEPKLKLPAPIYFVMKKNRTYDATLRALLQCLKNEPLFSNSKAQSS